MRELTTIGDLHAFRRLADRSVRLRGIGYISATNSLYVPPSSSELLAEPPSDATANAASTLLEHFVSYGVPSEHVTDPVVLAFQKAVNADPASWAQRKPQLGVDGGFGNNSHDVAAALAAALGSDTAVPAVNTSNATVPYTSSSSSSGVLTLPTIVVTGGKTAPATPTKPAALTTTSKSNAWKWVLGAGLAGVLAYAAHKMMKKRRARRRSASLPSRAIVLT